MNFLGGTVIAGGTPRPDIFVHLEGLDQQHLATVFTDSHGAFRFEGLTLENNFVYLVVDEDGFRPYMERLDLPYALGGALTVYLEPDLRATVTDGDSSVSVVDLGQLQAQIPEEAWEAYDDAVEESERGNHSDAVELVERALDLAPDFYEAQIMLGGEYSRLGRHVDAETAYRRAWDISPGRELAPLNLGVLYYQDADRARMDGNEPQAIARLEQARDVLDEAIQRNPVSADALFYLGATLYGLGAYQEAEQALVRSLDLDTRDGQARLMLVNVYARVGLLEEALDQANRFLEENPDSPQRPGIEEVVSQIESALRQ